MRRFIALRVATAIVCWLMLTVIVYAQTKTAVLESDSKQVIGSDTTLFSWGAVVLLGAIIVSAITAIAASKSHIADESIHHQGEKLAEKYAAKSDCIIKHGEVKQDFNRVHERLDKISEALARIEGKLVN